MIKITFIGAGSTVFARSLLGDIMLTPDICECEIALYDINHARLDESALLIEQINKKINMGRASVKKYLGVDNRRAALAGADFIINAIQVGGYEPCTLIDFDIPKKYGLRQTIADTLGIGGIFRAIRTLPVLEEIAKDIEDVCPNAWFLNYTNPMAMLTGFMQRYTKVKTIGLCHSIQVCSSHLLSSLGMEQKDGFIDKIAGINHMAWLLEIKDSHGNDLYPEIRKRAIAKNASEKHNDMVRFEYIKHFGYYCTESSEHNAEYNPYFIKSAYPELIDRYNIPLDEYPRRCVRQIEGWAKEREGWAKGISSDHKRTHEYASRIVEAIVTNKPYKFGGNVLNTGLITNLPHNACVEVYCIADGTGITPMLAGDLPVQLAALNMTNINPQLLTIEAFVTGNKEHIYHAAMLDPHTSAELSLDDITAMCDELLDAHAQAGYGFKSC